MVNPKTGQQADCSAMGWGWLGAPLAYSASEDCIATMEALGYVDNDKGEGFYGAKFEQDLSHLGVEAPMPELRGGDKWIYISNGKEIVGELTTQADGLVLRWSDGTKTAIDPELRTRWWSNMDGEVTKYNPPYQKFQWPLKLGSTWDAEHRITTPTGGNLSAFTRFKVSGYGVVKVPAGEYEAFHLLETNARKMRLSEAWYSPKVNNIVKLKWYDAGGANELALKAYEPVVRASENVPTSVMRSGTAENEPAARLSRLQKMYQDGVLAEAEYTAKRREIIDDL